MASESSQLSNMDHQWNLQELSTQLEQQKLNINADTEFKQLSLEINKHPLTLASSSNNSFVDAESCLTVAEPISRRLSQSSAKLNRTQMIERAINRYHLTNRLPSSSNTELKEQSIEINKRPLTLAPSSNAMELDQRITSMLSQSAMLPQSYPNLDPMHNTRRDFKKFHSIILPKPRNMDPDKTSLDIVKHPLYRSQVQTRSVERTQDGSLIYPNIKCEGPCGDFKPLYLLSRAGKTRENYRWCRDCAHGKISNKPEVNLMSAPSSDTLQKTSESIKPVSDIQPDIMHQKEAKNSVEWWWMHNRGKIMQESRNLWGLEVTPEVKQELTKQNTHLDGLTYNPGAPSDIDARVNNPQSEVEDAVKKPMVNSADAFDATSIDTASNQAFMEVNSIDNSANAEPNVNDAISQPILSFVTRYKHSDMENQPIDTGLQDKARVERIKSTDETKGGETRVQSIMPKENSVQTRIRAGYQDLDIGKGSRRIRVNPLLRHNQDASAVEDRALLLNNSNFDLPFLYKKDGGIRVNPLLRSNQNENAVEVRALHMDSDSKAQPSDLMDHAIPHKESSTAQFNTGNGEESVADIIPQTRLNPLDVTIESGFTPSVNANEPVVGFFFAHGKRYQRISYRTSIVYNHLKSYGVSTEMIYKLRSSSYQQKDVPIPLVEYYGSKCTFPQFLINGQLYEHLPGEEAEGKSVPAVPADIHSRPIDELNTPQPLQSPAAPGLSSKEFKKERLEMNHQKISEISSRLNRLKNELLQYPTDLSTSSAVLSHETQRMMDEARKKTLSFRASLAKYHAQKQQNNFDAFSDHTADQPLSQRADKSAIPDRLDSTIAQAQRILDGSLARRRKRAEEASLRLKKLNLLKRAKSEAVKTAVSSLHPTFTGQKASLNTDKQSTDIANDKVSTEIANTAELANTEIVDAAKPTVQNKVNSPQKVDESDAKFEDDWVMANDESEEWEML
ncbi:hypothetical protein NHQ30_004481 [Ciborinia camelliae]|nr:hypothetical protein NHQ30_004481 [Ciborinia camelliae]